MKYLCTTHATCPAHHYMTATENASDASRFWELLQESVDMWKQIREDPCGYEARTLCGRDTTVLCLRGVGDRWTVYGALVASYWQGKTLPLCPPQIPYSLGRPRASAVRGNRLTACPIAQPLRSSETLLTEAWQTIPSTLQFSSSWNTGKYVPIHTASNRNDGREDVTCSINVLHGILSTHDIFHSACFYRGKFERLRKKVLPFVRRIEHSHLLSEGHWLHTGLLCHLMTLS